MTAALASFVAQLPEKKPYIEAAKQFHFDADAIRMADELSKRDWREWLPMARAPFPVTWMEWSPDDYLSNISPLPHGNRRIERVGCLIGRSEINVEGEGEGGTESYVLPTIQQHAMFYFTFKRKAVTIPFTLLLDLPTDGLEVAEIYTAKAFSEPYVRKFGAPPIPVVCPSEYLHGTARLLLKDTIDCFIGTPRIGMACLALLNAEKDRQPYPESYLSGRTHGAKSNTIPAYRPAVIHLRPNAIRYVMERAAKEPTGVRRCEHDVKGHWRTLPGRKVWVRNHTRGDKSLGRKESRYVVESAPPTVQLVSSEGSK